MEKRIKEERKIMVSKGGVPKGRIIPVYLTEMCTLFIYMRWES